MTRTQPTGHLLAPGVGAMSAPADLAWLHNQKECELLQQQHEEWLLEQAKQAIAKDGCTAGRYCHMVLQSDCYEITPEMILALAARAGCLMVSHSVFDRIRGIAQVYLENLTREVAMIVEHKKRKVILARDVLAAATAPGKNCRNDWKILCGTGRVASMHAANASGCGTPSAFAKLAAKYAAIQARGQDAGGDEDKHLKTRNDDGFNEVVTRAWGGACDDLVYDTDEYKGRARHPSGVPFLTEEEILADPGSVHKGALRYIRRMQQTSCPCLPFLPLSIFIRQIAQDFRTGLDFEPEAFRVMQSMLEDYLVGLFQDANLNCISLPPHPDCGYGDGREIGRKFAITPEGLHLARRIRRETSQVLERA